MKKIFCSVVFLVVSALSVFAEDIIVDNISRNYIVYAPKNLGDNRPLLISCHGMNQDAAYQKGMLQIESIADTAKFVTVFPNGIDRGWDIGGDRDLRFMQVLIDEMVAKYNIDRNRVYISGFSMGGMFTYHAMNRMADKFAAFAPISGYPMGGGNYTSSRPVPIIHTHGTGDDVVGFGGVAGILAGWVKRNGCPSTAKVVKPYRANHITKHTWAPGENGVEVVLLELEGKGHWISNDIVKTGEEIWNFCKRYSLELKDPSVRIISPADGLSYITFGGKSEVPSFTVNATASDPDGKVVSVAFYDGDKLLAELYEAPFACVVDNLEKGTHAIRAVATDDEGRTGSSEITILVEEPASNYVFTKFITEGCVPAGWTTYDGSEKRIGFSSGFSSGSRVFKFTGSKRDFDWGLYTRNTTGGKKAGYARFADKGTSTTMILNPGSYQLYHRLANWNQPNFSPITIAIETIDGKEAFSTTYTPACNVGNSAANDFTGTSLKSFTFDIHEKGQYVITFYTADAPWADLVIGQSALRRKADVSAIDGVTNEKQPLHTYYYNMAGQPVGIAHGGVYIEKKIMSDGSSQSKKIIK